MKKQYRVKSGFVECPLRGKIDVELCFYCARCDEVDLDSQRPFIHCEPNMPLSKQDKVAYERLSLLQMAEMEGNVSKVCRDFHISRRLFYRWKHRYEALGLDGLKDRRPKRGRMRLEGAAFSKHL